MKAINTRKALFKLDTLCTQEGGTARLAGGLTSWAAGSGLWFKHDLQMAQTGQPVHIDKTLKSTATSNSSHLATTAHVLHAIPTGGSAAAVSFKNFCADACPVNKAIIHPDGAVCTSGSRTESPKVSLRYLHCREHKTATPHDLQFT